MNIKKDECILVMTPFNKQSEIIIRDLVKSGMKIKLGIDNIKTAKQNLFDIWEKFDSVNQFEINYESDDYNLNRKIQELISIKKGRHPNTMLIMTKNTDLENEKVNFIENLKLVERNIMMIKYLLSKEMIFTLTPNKLIFINLIDNEEKINNSFNTLKQFINDYFEQKLRELWIKKGKSYSIVRVNNDENNNISTLISNLTYLDINCDITVNDGSYLYNPYFKHIPFMREYFKFSNYNLYRRTIKQGKLFQPKIDFNKEIAKNCFLIGISLRLTSFLFKKLF